MIEKRIKMEKEFENGTDNENSSPVSEEETPVSEPAADEAPENFDFAEAYSAAVEAEEVSDESGQAEDAVTTDTEAEMPEEAPEAEPTAEPVKKKKKKKRFTLKKEFTIFAISAAVAFTVCFFAPIDIFIGNQHEFAVSAPRIIYPLLAAAGVGTLALMIIFNILLAINVRLWKIVSTLFSGGLLAGYVQMMFMNKRMVTITGDAAPYSERTNANYANLAIFIIVALLPTLVMIFSGDLKKKKKNRFHMRALTYISVALIVMQGVGVVGRISKLGIEKSDDSQFDNFLSLKDATNLNKDENIVVFLTDRLDANYLQDVLDEYPDLSTELEGFTFYANNTSGFTNTFPSLPQMLTTRKYMGGEWVPYMKDAWAGQTLPRRLKNGGYSVNMIIDASTTFTSYDNIIGQCDNVKSAENYVEYNYFDEGGILRTMGDFSIGKLAPYLAKGRFLNGYSSDFSSHFYTITDDIPERIDASIGAESDLKVYNYVKDHGITTDNPNKTFTFIHLNFAHDGDYALSAVYPGFEGGDPDRETTIRGGFAGINRYLQAMKDAGVYDNSTIILLGDHGRPPAEVEYASHEERDSIVLDGEIRTSLLIKPAGAAHDPLVINKEAELSNDYFPASILDYAGLYHEDLGPSYNELMESDNYPARYLHVYCWQGIGNIEDVLQYEITGDASDFSNWKVVERRGQPADK